MLKFELKKFFLKQYVLLLISIVVLIKLFVSVDLFKPDYSGLSRQQQLAYLEYIEELGGRLTAEKEEKIRELYAELLQAQTMQQEFQRKLDSGEYTSVEDYFADVATIPLIISNEYAIMKLFHSYEIVSEDIENRIIIGSDAPVMAVDMEYLLLFLLCYMSAAAFYYERKTSDLQKTTPKSMNATVGKILSLFFGILLAWVFFVLIEFFALISEIGWSSLPASIVSLESFGYSNYPDMSIFAVFISIHLIKLVGYLLVSSIAAFLAKVTKNFPLSIFAPAAINIVWIYLFGSNTISFYNPFSLMRGAPYFIGGDHVYGEYDMIPQSILIALICIAFAAITAITFFLVTSGRNKMKKFLKKLTLVTFVLMLCGCSQNSVKNTANAATYIAYSDGMYFICNDEYIDNPDTNGFIITGTNIAMCDENFNVIEEKLNRRVFDRGTIISQIYADEKYLYYSDQSRICRIDLTDYTEETLIEFDASIRSSGTTRYLDMIRDYPAEYTERGDFQIDSFIVNGDKIIMLMHSAKVYSFDINTGIASYLFEDVTIGDICLVSGRLFFIDRMGRLTLFEGKKEVLSDRILTDICADGDYIYACNSEGIFRYDPNSFEETKLSDIGSSYIVAKNGRFFLEKSYKDYYMMDEKGEKEVTLPEGYYFTTLSEDGRLIVQHEMGYLIMSEIN